MTSGVDRAGIQQTSVHKSQNATGRSANIRNNTNTRLGLPTIAAFVVFTICHTAAAIYAPIQDCDEVFNYWEPTHYLTNGHGLQTWEYAPRYAIRSWAYAGLHALLIWTGRLGLSLESKITQFYYLRIVLGLVCAVCEARLFSKISKTMNERIGILFLLVLASSPGMFHASVAYLPSSFAMYTAMLGASAFMDWSGGLRTAQGIFWFGLGACLGWPFAVALAVPFLLEELLMALLADRSSLVGLSWRVLDGSARSLIALGTQVAIDAFFYRKLTVVPLNIVLYNVFSSKGPDLYGTDPWHFYLRNLVLNFHLWLPLAMLALPLHVLQTLSTKRSYKSLRGFFLLAPFYLWLVIFSVQPHKEERFMYPAYPFIALNAAYSLHILLTFLGGKDDCSLIAHIPVMVRLTAIIGFLTLTMALSILKVAGTWTAFPAPLHIYDPLASSQAVPQARNVCLGKEWYRFPSHYHLSDNVTARFVRSEFRGLLPGQFIEADDKSEMFSGTFVDPPGMNDENTEDPGKYTDLEHCDFLVDSRLPSTQITSLEPDFINNREDWEQITCTPFLDTSKTGLVGRLSWVPDLPFLPASFRRVWGEYCLLKRKKRG